jgi:restriction endonuclease S subunit
MTTSEIKFGQIENRLDAEYYLPLTLEVRAKINRWRNIVSLADVSNVFDGPFGSEIHAVDYVTTGIPFLRTDDIAECFVKLDNFTYIRPEDHKRISRSTIFPNDVVITKTGAYYGIAAVIPSELKEANIRADLAGIRPYKELNPFYLAVFLNSHFGYTQVRSERSGGSRPRIIIENLKTIKIPIPSPSFQSRIESLVKAAHEKWREAQKELQEAEEILEKELGWKKLELNHDKAFETSFSHLERRCDPEYFKPRYKRIEEVLLVKDAKLLSKAVKIITKRADFRKTPDKIIKYVAIADIDPESSQIISHAEMPAYQAPSRATYEIKEGFILTATSGNSTGTKRHASCFVTKKEDGFICTNGLIPLQPKEGIEPLYFFFYLKSPFFLEQVKRELTGAAIPAISLQDMRQIFIYLPAIKIQKEIAKLVEISNQLRGESRNLIEQAKKEVEEMIEKGTA